MKRSLFSTAPARVTFLLALALVACDADRSPREASAPDTSAAGSGVLTPAGADTAPGRVVPLDPATGSLGATAVGAVKGAWTFDDVNGSRIESVRGGTTRNALQIEAHQVPPDVHLRLLLSADEELSTGRYPMGAASGRMLDAHFEYKGEVFRSIGQARGTVELTAVTNDRAVGTYEVTLESLRASKKLVTVSGAFDLRVQ